MNIQELSQLISDSLNIEVLNLEPVKNPGEVNQVFIAETSSLKFILRIDPNESTTSRFEKEKFCIEAAKDKGVAGPEVYEIGSFEDHPYMILEFIEGQRGDEYQSTDLIWTRLGEYCKKSHSIKVEGFGENMTAPGKFDDRWERFIDYNIESLNPDDQAIKLKVITPQESEVIKKLFIDLKSQNLKFGLCHHDLSLKNTIVKDDNVYLIDWGSANVGPVPHLDFAEILDSSLSEDSAEFKLFLEAYGMTVEEYQKFKPQINAVNLLMHVDKLRWAIDRNNKERLEFYIRKVKEKLKKSIIKYDK